MYKIYKSSESKKRVDSSTEDQKDYKVYWQRQLDKINLSPAVVAAKLEYLTNISHDLRRLKEEFPLDFYTSALSLLEISPELINKPEIFIGLLKQRLSHAGLQPSEVAAVVEKIKKKEQPTGDSS
jgi:hypothetical protein